MPASPARYPSAVLPVLMSLLALAAIAYQLVRFGTAPQADEGGPAHIWQLLMAGQVPIIIYYAVRWLPQAPGTAVRVLAVQAAAGIAAAAPVFLLGW